MTQFRLGVVRQALSAFFSLVKIPHPGVIIPPTVDHNSADHMGVS
jgi:hypothetical protein